MTSATTRSARGTRGRGGEGYGLVLFAAVMLLISRFFNLIDGIAAIANSHVFVANAHYVIGDLRAWGWVTLILSVLQLAAELSVLSDYQVYRRSGGSPLELKLID